MIFGWPGFMIHVRWCPLPRLSWKYADAGSISPCINLLLSCGEIFFFDIWKMVLVFLFVYPSSDDVLTAFLAWVQMVTIVDGAAHRLALDVCIR